MRASGGKRSFGRSNFLREAALRTGVLALSLPAGFAFGPAYRAVFNTADGRSLGFFLRSGLQGAGPL